MGFYSSPELSKLLAHTQLYYTINKHMLLENSSRLTVGLDRSVSQAAPWSRRTHATVLRHARLSETAPMGLKSHFQTRPIELQHPGDSVVGLIV